MIGKTARRFWCAAAGTAAIEFAFLAVPFLGLSLAMYEFGRACWTMEALQESAAQGARCVGVHETGCYSGGSYSSTGTITYVQNVAQGWGISVPTADITPTQSTTCGTVAGFSQIQISYTYSTVVGLLLRPLQNFPISVSACFPSNT